MTRYLHTMVRITDPEKSGAFYEALGLGQLAAMRRVRVAGFVRPRVASPVGTRAR